MKPSLSKLESIGVKEDSLEKNNDKSTKSKRSTIGTVNTMGTSSTSSTHTKKMVKSKREPRDTESKSTNTSSKKGNRTGKRWSLEEEEELLKSVQNKESWTDMSKNHGRTEDALKVRYNGIIKRWVEHDSMSVDDIAEKMGGSPDEIMEIVDNETIKSTTVPSSNRDWKTDVRSTTTTSSSSHHKSEELSDISEQIRFLTTTVNDLKEDIQKMSCLMKDIFHQISKETLVNDITSPLKDPTEIIESTVLEDDKLHTG